MATHDVVLSFLGFFFRLIGLFQCMTFGCGKKDATCIRSIHPVQFPFQASYIRSSPPICTIAGGGTLNPIIVFFFSYSDSRCIMYELADCSPRVIAHQAIRGKADQKGLAPSLTVHISTGFLLNPRHLNPDLYGQVIVYSHNWPAREGGLTWLARRRAA